MTTTFTDNAILDLLRSPSQAENDRALQHLYTRHYRMIEQLILKNSGEQSDAADIFQDALISFYNQVKQKNLQLTCAISTYLYSISRNLWLRKLRNRGRQTPLQDFHEHIETNENHLQSIIQDERSETIADLLGDMGEECQQILLCYYYERLRMKEIQARMGMTSEQVVKNKKSKCMKKLREKVLTNPALVQLLKH